MLLSGQKIQSEWREMTQRNSSAKWTLNQKFRRFAGSETSDLSRHNSDISFPEPTSRMKESTSVMLTMDWAR